MSILFAFGLVVMGALVWPSGTRFSEEHRAYQQRIPRLLRATPYHYIFMGLGSIVVMVASEGTIEKLLFAAAAANFLRMFVLVRRG